MDWLFPIEAKLTQALEEELVNAVLQEYDDKE